MNWQSQENRAYVGAPINVWVMFDGFCRKAEEFGSKNTAYFDHTSFSMETINTLTKYGLIFRDFYKPKIQNSDDTTRFFPEYPYTLTEFGKFCRDTSNRYAFQHNMEGIIIK